MLNIELKLLIIVTFLCLAQGCNFKREYPISSLDFTYIAKQQLEYAYQHSKIANKSEYIIRLIEIEKKLRLKNRISINNLDYYIMATDLPKAFITIDGKFFISSIFFVNDSDYFCTEDELAAIIAHELGHIVNNHFLKQIEEFSYKYSIYFDTNYNINYINFEDTLLTTAPFLTKTINRGFYDRHKEDIDKAIDFNKRSKNFDTVDDQKKYELYSKPKEEIFSSINHGFSLNDENEADIFAITILKNSCYSTQALINVINKHIAYLNNHRNFFSFIEINNYLLNFDDRIKKIKGEL